MTIEANWKDVRDQIQRACVRGSHAADEVRLVAVTKYAPLEAVRTLVELGQVALGEARPQQLVERAGELSASAVQWHLIGHLQGNKIRKVLPLVSLIHSVDSQRLAERIDRVARDLELRPRVLIEVNIAGESSKDGLDPISLRALWPRLERLENIEIAGLMTMAPQVDDPEEARPVFRELRELRDELSAEGRWELPDLSMGMSGDFEVAIEEGATLVRVGSRLFEG